MTATITEIVFSYRSVMFSPGGNYFFTIQLNYIHRIIIVVEITDALIIIRKGFFATFSRGTWVNNLILPHSEAKLDNINVF